MGLKLKGIARALFFWGLLGAAFLSWAVFQSSLARWFAIRAEPLLGNPRLVGRLAALAYIAAAAATIRVLLYLSWKFWPDEKSKL